MEAFFSVLVSFPPIQRFFYALSQIFCYFVLHFLIVDPIPALTVVVDVSRCDPQLCGMERNIQSASIVSISREMKNIKLLPRYVCLHVFSFTCKLDEMKYRRLQGNVNFTLKSRQYFCLTFICSSIDSFLFSSKSNSTLDSHFFAIVFNVPIVIGYA